MDLIGYLSSGYPSREDTLKNAAAYIEGGCDVLEIDLPTDNPYIDGELIQHRMIHSYNNDPSLKTQTTLIREIHALYPTQRIFLLAYEKTIIDFGIEEFLKLYNDVKAETLILVAMMDDKVKNELMSNGVKIASYIPFHLPTAELSAAKNTNGFIYLQSKPDDPTLSEHKTLKEVIHHLRTVENIQVPIYCGVGISTSNDVQYIKESGGEGAFVGSGIIKREGNKDLLVNYLKELKQATL